MQFFLFWKSFCLFGTPEAEGTSSIGLIDKFDGEGLLAPRFGFMLPNLQFQCVCSVSVFW